MTTLEFVAAAAHKSAAAERNLRAEVARAVADGLPIAHIAKAAGVTRRTVYAWARESAPTRP